MQYCLSKIVINNCAFQKVTSRKINWFSDPVKLLAWPNRMSLWSEASEGGMQTTVSYRMQCTQYGSCVKVGWINLPFHTFPQTLTLMKTCVWKKSICIHYPPLFTGLFEGYGTRTTLISKHSLLYLKSSSITISTVVDGEFGFQL